MPAVIVDTNVAVTANGDANDASPKCIRRCLQELRLTRSERMLLLDDARLILGEYLAQKPHGFPQGPGDAFMVWVNDNQANPDHVRIVPITPLVGDERGFAEFPDDPDLEGFDRDDRMFVAVALNHGEAPPILNATDTDWWDFREALERCGVNVQFLCPERMGRK